MTQKWDGKGPHPTAVKIINMTDFPKRPEKEQARYKYWYLTTDDTMGLELPKSALLYSYMNDTLILCTRKLSEQTILENDLLDVS